VSSSTERAILVGLLRRGRPDVDPERALDELAALAEAAGAEVVGRVVQERPAPDPATFLGAGKVDALAGLCAALEADLVLVDNELTPAQLRNLEQRLQVKVVDRTQLILDIFARRARTREGQLQVELAQLRYLLPRLVGRGQALSRLGGGIGTRGPGETKLETDRRRIRRRIATLVRALEEVRRRRSRLRRRRARAEAPVVSLVGYTNAGKTTLFNTLTGEAARVSDALFVTLDPLIRRMRLDDGGTVLLTDTVGFIERLPYSLVAAFRATLEEIVDADLLLHVVDAASPERARHVRTVEEVLAEIGGTAVPRLLVFNKCDLLDAEALARLQALV
jgi:GTP-binding protein HflX